jgi:hypothetical protein
MKSAGKRPALAPHRLDEYLRLYTIEHSEIGVEHDSLSAIV